MVMQFLLTDGEKLDILYDISGDEDDLSNAFGFNTGFASQEFGTNH